MSRIRKRWVELIFEVMHGGVSDSFVLVHAHVHMDGVMQRIFKKLT